MVKEKLVDFLILHWCDGIDVERFKNWVDKMYEKYHLPLWVTEFNGWSGRLKELTVFATDSFKILGEHHGVERYVYFAQKRGGPRVIRTAGGKPVKIGKTQTKAT